MHERFEHVAVFHRGVDDLVARLGPWLTNSLAADDAVLLCVEDQSAAAVRDVLSTHAGQITVVPADVRYERPASAVRVLYDAVQQSLRDGATRVWSIGRVEQTDDEGRWARYEAAVDDVLGDRRGPRRETVDHGPGLHDPWPDLRPRPAGTVGGLGLWMVGQLTDRFCIDRGPGGETVVSAAADAP